MTYHQVCNTSNAMGATYGAGTAYHSEHMNLIPVFSVVGVAQCLVFCVIFYRSLFDVS